ncbi:hypothetical protein [Hyperthermus butylicus]|uniref:Conserved crenarchaeal protein n=1 Tax=Hyperthermus butylicus (strain DSM 5456 / JCM 9403 / PLM1-5) TaxID=415426 RepID=A2BLK4_HYPBU|nr:hypothetical protein [Hyperthermus butylicus]ABM80865.1 conserved crenarchaeal protein [Hyperthermus butylicus DSM 5456]
MAQAPGVRERVLEFLAEYGERGYAVLRAAVDAAVGSRGRRGIRLGDFSYREVVARLRAWGIEYNPSMLLRVLERDYGIVETSYRSSNQHWWRFIDLDAVIEALEAYEQGVNVSEDTELEEAGDEVEPEVALLQLQIASISPDQLAEKLEALASKPRLTQSDLAFLRGIAFNELELAVKLLRKAEELGYEGPEVETLHRLVRAAARLARKMLTVSRLSVEARRTLALLARTAGGKLGSTSEVP